MLYIFSYGLLSANQLSDGFSSSLNIILSLLIKKEGKKVVYICQMQYKVTFK